MVSIWQHRRGIQGESIGSNVEWPVLVSILPTQTGYIGSGFRKFSRKKGDFSSFMKYVTRSALKKPVDNLEGGYLVSQGL